MPRTLMRILVILSFFITFILFYQVFLYNINTIKIFNEIKSRNIDCNLRFLKGFEANFSYLIIDEQFLNKTCKNIQKLKIGVDVKFMLEPNILSDQRFEVVFYQNDSNKDYLDFRTTPRRTILKNFESMNIDKIMIPTNPKLFAEYWRRSLFVECLNLTIPRSDMSIYLDVNQSTAMLSMLRDELINFEMFPFLNGGTLLGWYRECSVIPHTLDMDLSVFIEDYNPEFQQSFANASSFVLNRRLGRLNDSLEFTVKPKQGYGVFIDIFMMYKDAEEDGTPYRWVGGCAGNGDKFKYSYPDYDPWCSADLHGHLFWITCSPMKMLKYEYGNLWYQDFPSNKFSWSSSHQNVKPNGKWTEAELEENKL